MSITATFLLFCAIYYELEHEKKSMAG